jgi:hypothetical protein
MLPLDLDSDLFQKTGDANEAAVDLVKVLGFQELQDESGKAQLVLTDVQNRKPGMMNFLRLTEEYEFALQGEICFHDAENVSVGVAKLAVLFHSDLVQTLASCSTSIEAEMDCRKTVACIEQGMHWLQVMKPSGMLWFAWEIVKIQMIMLFSEQPSTAEDTVSELCDFLLGASAILILCLRVRLPMEVVRVFGFAHVTSALAVAIGLEHKVQLSSDDLVVYMTSISSLPGGCLSHQYMGSIQGIQQLLGQAQSQALSEEEMQQLVETLRWQLKKLLNHFHPITASFDYQGTVNMDDLIELASGLNINELEVLLTGDTTDGPGGLPFSILGILPSQPMTSLDDSEMPEADLEEKKDKEKMTQQQETSVSFSDSDISADLREDVLGISLMDEVRFRQEVLSSLSSKADVEMCHSNICQLMSKETSKLRALHCEKDELLQVQESSCHADVVKDALCRACAEKQAEIDMSLSVTQKLEKFNDLLEEVEFNLSQTTAMPSETELLQTRTLDLSLLLSQILLTSKGNANILTELFVRTHSVCAVPDLLSLSCQT